MQNPAQNNAPENQRPPRLRLPFENRKSDVGTWSYRHRAGIAITVIAYLLFGIVFISARIQLGYRGALEGILIDFGQENNTERTQTDPMEQARWEEMVGTVRNQASNENAELNSSLRDDRGTAASELYDDAGGLDDRLRANRQAYEQGLLEEQAILESRRNNNENTQQVRQDTRVQGNVTVSFSFMDPIRTSVNLPVPAYMCEGGGQVVVSATLNNNGNVVAASVDRSRSTSDQCMQTTALGAANSSRFNLDNNAPGRHTGTITYVFVPQ